MSSYGVIPIFTWGNRPPASALPPGTRIRISDMGAAPGMLVVTDGANWTPQGVQVLARSGAPSSMTNTGLEVALATIVIPGGMMGLNGALRIRSAWSVTSSANSKTIRARLGGTVMWANSLTSSQNSEDYITIRNLGATNSQRGPATNTSGQSAVTGTGYANGSVDTSVDQLLTLTGALNTITETVNLLDYSVEIFS